MFNSAKDHRHAAHSFYRTILTFINTKLGINIRSDIKIFIIALLPVSDIPPGLQRFIVILIQPFTLIGISEVAVCQPQPILKTDIASFIPAVEHYRVQRYPAIVGKPNITDTAFLSNLFLIKIKIAVGTLPRNTVAFTDKTAVYSIFPRIFKSKNNSGYSLVTVRTDSDQSKKIFLGILLPGHRI